MCMYRCERAGNNNSSSHVQDIKAREQFNSFVHVYIYISISYMFILCFVNGMDYKLQMTYKHISDLYVFVVTDPESHLAF